jgi:hypothetical protein
MTSFMNVLVFFAALFAATVQQLHAGEIVTDKNGNKIQLNDDKTWQYLDDPSLDIPAIKQSVLGYSMAGDFDAAFVETSRIMDVDDRDLVLLNIWNFTVQKSDCTAMGKIVENLSNPGKKLVFGLNHKNLCPE